MLSIPRLHVKPRLHKKSLYKRTQAVNRVLHDPIKRGCVCVWWRGESPFF